MHGELRAVLWNDRQLCGINEDAGIANMTKTSTAQYLEWTKMMNADL